MMIEIAECSGSNPLTILGEVDALTPFHEFMQQLGSPQYGGNPSSGYRPNYSSLLQPVIWFERRLDANGNYIVKKCHWLSVVYQRSMYPYYYQR